MVVIFVPVNIASESQRKVGIGRWRYQPDESQSGHRVVATFMKANGFPTRVHYDRIGHLTFLLNQAGFQVNFRPFPEKDQRG